MFSFPVLLTVYAGFTHAFEADHLLAVSNIVSQRNNTRLSLKDGIYWGLGHASTIIVMGVLMILFKASMPDEIFQNAEAFVGIMLIGLALYRLKKLIPVKEPMPNAYGYAIARGQLLHHQMNGEHKQSYKHLLAYVTGVVHGMAGSGALIFLIISQIKRQVDGLICLVIFCAGCIIGMLLAAGLFSVPFSKRMMQVQPFQNLLVICSSMLCIFYGVKIIYSSLAW